MKNRAAIAVALNAPLEIHEVDLEGPGAGEVLVVPLRNPDRYRSVSAFAPIVAPSQVPSGEKRFAAYPGRDRTQWRRYDAVALIEGGASIPEILVDHGYYFISTFIEDHLRWQARRLFK